MKEERNQTKKSRQERIRAYLSKTQAISEFDIPRKPDDERIGLSFSQQNIWLNIQKPTSAKYNLAIVEEFQQSPNPIRLDRSIQTLIKANHALGTFFEQNEENEIIQKLTDKNTFQVHQVSCGNKEEALTFINTEIEKPFSLFEWPLFRGYLIDVSGKTTFLLFVFHHIIMDGTSLGVFKKQLSEAYNASDNTTSETLGPQFHDYVSWEQKNWMKRDQTLLKMFWQDYLKDFSMSRFHTSELHILDNEQADTQEAKIDLSIFDQLFSLEFEGRRATPYQILFSAFQTLIYQYTGTEDVVLGSPTANRNDMLSLSMIGCFVNTTVVRNKIQPDAKFSSIVLDNMKLLDALEEHRIPFVKLIDFVNPRRFTNNNPFFQIYFAVQNYTDSPINFRDLISKRLKKSVEFSRFDIEFNCWIKNHQLVTSITYKKAFFTSHYIKRLLKHWENVLRCVAINPDTIVSNIDLFKAKEQNLLAPHIKEKSSFSKDVGTNPLLKFAQDSSSKIAVEFKNESISYGELHDRISKYASALQSEGIRIQERVGVCIDRSVESIVLLFALMNIKAVYVPLDVSLPVNHLERMMDQAEVSKIIIDDQTKDKIQKIAKPYALILLSKLNKVSDYKHINSDLKPDHLAYIMFTSGSTGLPKGVQVTNDNLYNCILSSIELFGFDQKDVFPSIAPFHFDISIWELLCVLYSGGTLLLLTKSELLAPQSLSKAITRVSAFHAIPSLMNEILELIKTAELDVHHIKKIFVGGEAVTPNLSRNLRNTFYNSEIHILYGPTETTIICSTYTLSKETIPEKITIGYPMQGVDIKICSPNGRVLPNNIPGEIYVGGLCVSKGYVGHHPKNKESFIQIGNMTYYRTGDLGKIDTSGMIEFLGRKDTTLKINGYQVNPTQIESVLNDFPLINLSAVVISKLPTTSYINAFLQYNDHHKPAFQKAESKYLDHWTKLFEKEYDRLAQNHEKRDRFFGWNSSYDGKPIHREEMNNWLNETHDKIWKLQPDKVYEIGCGNGLVYSEIVDKVSLLYASDISQHALSMLEHQHKEVDVKTRLFLCRAHDFSHVVDQQFDTIILNSVVQYFSDVSYLNQVLSSSIDQLSDTGGNIFIGDVRNLDLLEAFYLDTQLYKSPDHLSMDDFNSIVNRNSSLEKELVISPKFFRHFAKTHNSVSSVKIELKGSLNLNELVRYRYDVTLVVGKTPHLSIKEVVYWNEINTIEHLIELLSSKNAEVVKIADIPNGRLSDVKSIQQIRHLTKISNVKELREAVSKQNYKHINPGNLLEFKKLFPKHTFELHCHEDDPFLFHLFVYKSELGTFYESISETHPSAINYDATTFRQYTNFPLKNYILKEIEPELMVYCKENLPAHLIPNKFELITLFPKNANGKIDRSLLKKSVFFAPNLDEDEIKLSKTERIIAEIWKKILHLSSVSRNSNFFNLGGNSLMIIQLIARLKKYQIQIAMEDVILYQELSRLATFIDTQQKIESVADMDDTHTEIEISHQNAPFVKPIYDEFAEQLSVLITGGTGFIGAHFVKEVLLHTQWKLKLMLRGENLDSIKEKIEQRYHFYFPDLDINFWNRIEIIQVDFKKDALGISSWSDLKSIFDVNKIYHIAADVGHVGAYGHFEQVNTKTTKTLIEYALQQPNTEFYYFSTVGIFSSGASSKKSEVTEHDFDIGQEFSNPYSKSKFEAEKIVFDAIQSGLKAQIFRLATIGPDYVHGTFQINIKDHFFTQFLKGCVDLGFAPYIPNRFVNLTPVDELAFATLALSVNQKSTSSHVFHVINPKRISYYNIIKTLHIMGFSITLLDQDRFANLVYKELANTNYLEAINEFRNYLDPKNSAFRIRSDETQRILFDIGITFSDIDSEWIYKFIVHCVEQNFIAAPISWKKNKNWPTTYYDEYN